MTIDWNKPLECEHGELEVLTTSNYAITVMCGDATWLVSRETGESTDPWMPRVYNAKRKPKEGEWWMCRIGMAREKPLLRCKETWAEQTKEGLYYSPRNVEPLYPLIKDPDF